MKHHLTINIRGILVAGLMSLTSMHIGSMTHLGYSQGLSNGCVMSMAEDSHGNLWFATENGLNRWDGMRFHSYLPFNSSLYTTEFNSLLALDNDKGFLYLSSQRDGIFRINSMTRQIEQVKARGIVSSDIADLSAAPDGGMWISHYHFGPQFYDPARQIIYPPIAKQVPGLPALCWTAMENKDHKILVGHVDCGFSVVDTVTKKFVNFQYPRIAGNVVRAICVDNNENVWIGTDGGASLYIPSTGKIINFVHDPANPKSIGAGTVRSIKLMKDGRLWFGTSQGGISILDLKSNAYSDIASAPFENLPVDYAPGGTSSAYVNTIFQDSHDNIWVGNNSTGIDFINHIPEILSRTKYLNANGSGHYTPVWCTGLDSSNQVWFGTESGIGRIDSDGNVAESIPLPYTNSSNAPIARCILPDTDHNRVWVGTIETGVYVYDTVSRQWSHISGIERGVNSLVMHGDKIYVGNVRGVYTIARNSLDAQVATDITQQLVDKHVTSISFDRNGLTWIGSFGKGIYIFDRNGKLLKRHHVAVGFPSNTINNIIHDRSGGSWVATRRGLVRFDNNRYDRYHKIQAVDDLGTTHVMSLAQDLYGYIWMSSDNDLVRINPQTEGISVFSSNPRVPLNSFNSGVSTQNKNNEIFFASINGLIVIKPEALGTPVDKCPIIVTGISALSQGINSNDEGREVTVVNGKAKINHDENTFVVTISSADFGLMDHAEFSYKLEGQSDNWNETRGDNRIVFSNISPGTYKLLIRYRIMGGEWSEPQELLEINITPPFWLSWWAITLYILIAIGVIALIFHLIHHRYLIRRQLAIETERNISAQALTEERLRFYTNVTHELRTPLTLIMGPLEDIVSDPTLPAKFSYKLKVMRNSANSLMELINGILEFRKTETQNRRLTVHRGNPAELVREIGLRFKELRQNKNVDIILDIEPETPDMLYDSDIISTVMNNLLSNAVKYTSKGSITVGCHTVTGPDNVRRTEMTVADTGYGISQKAIGHIFERYYQANDAHQASGSGIGLAMVKKLADLHGASLTVNSEVGKGSLFKFSIATDATYPEALHIDKITAPAPAEEIQAEPTADNMESVDNAAGRRRILVVEDNEDIREYIRRTLMEDADVVTASNGLEGLNRAHEATPDIVISDIMMPEMDGITLCRTLKEDVLTSHIPVILLTAKDSLDDKEEGYESGADSYITKPFSAKLLKSRIHNLMMSRRHLAEYLLKRSAPSLAPAPVVETAAISTVINTPHQEQEEEKALNPLDRQFLDKLMEIIEEHLASEELSVTFLADKMCMSISTLYRKVMALLGVSPNEYIRHIRLGRAIEMLKSRETSINEVAYRTGFGSHSSFCKVFRKVYGMAPTEYINSLSQNN